MPTTADAVRLGSYWQNVPDRRTMSFRRRTSAGPPPVHGQEIEIANCWHRNFVTLPQSSGSAVYAIQTCDIYMPRVNAAIDTALERPLPGDTITDNTSVPQTAQTWTIEQVSDVGALRAWKLGCVLPTIIGATGISVKFQNPVVSISNAGQRVVSSWTDITTVTAWVQQTQTQADDTLGCRTMVRNATIYTSAYPTTTAQSVVFEVATSRRYTIVAYRPAQSVAVLNEYDLELIP
jgi:hypothetical protein